MNKFKKYFKRHPYAYSFGKGILFFILLFFILNILFPLPPLKKYSVQILDNKKNTIHAFLTPDDKWRLAADPEEIPQHLVDAFLYKEDQYFYYHPGFNPLAIGRALSNNLIKHKKTSGASTITMQVARLMEPKKRSYSNKLVELFRALQLELTYSKKEILHLYLNYIPYGSNVEGVSSAAMIYFKKNLRQVSPAEIAVLTIVPNRPSSLRPGRANLNIITERNKWLHRYVEGEIFTPEELEDANKEPLLVHRHPMPQEITQLALRLKKNYPGEHHIFSCIEPKTQKTCEALSSQYLLRQHSKGIFNASIIVMNNNTKEIIGYIASTDFKDSEHDGQIDGTQAIRSPGSTLKPFVYAQAFDKGLLTPKSIIADVPTDFNGYAPANFDQKFYGKVSVEKALSYSLNIPAVKTLELVGQKEFIEVLKKGGFQTIHKKANQLGPSLILGGCGVTLEEITHAFTAFTNKGKLVPYHLTKNNKDKHSVELFSPASAYMIHEILSTISRPDLPNHFQNTYRVPRIAWKTGTSYGRRDAWSIGYSKNYTIGVWIGNFDGEGVPELTGADIATPLLFQLFNALDYNASGDWFEKPEQLSFRYVCPESGSTPGELCQHTVMDYFIPNISSGKKCTHLQSVFVSPDGKFRYCGNCMPELGYIKKTFLNLSPEMVSFYQREQLPFDAVPPHNPYCDYSVTGKPPEIISPIHRKEYLIEKLSPSEILLKSRCASDVKKVFWYINDVFYKEAKIGEPVFFTPEEGRLKISCSDDKGNNSNIEIEVVYF